MPVTVPLEFSSVTQTYAPRSHIMEVVWSGSTTAGDEVVLRATNGARIWRGHATGTDTYQGINFGDGVLAPNGFEFEILDSGFVLVYIRGV